MRSDANADRLPSAAVEGVDFDNAKISEQFPHRGSVCARGADPGSIFIQDRGCSWNLHDDDHAGLESALGGASR